MQIPEPHQCIYTPSQRLNRALGSLESRAWPFFKGTLLPFIPALKLFNKLSLLSKTCFGLLHSYAPWLNSFLCGGKDQVIAGPYKFTTANFSGGNYTPVLLHLFFSYILRT